MNLYDMYMTSCDREACPEELRAVSAAASPSPAPAENRSAALSMGCDMYPSLAMVYSPVQCFRKLYSPEEALSRGTLFEELDKPLMVGRKR